MQLLHLFQNNGYDDSRALSVLKHAIILVDSHHQKHKQKASVVTDSEAATVADTDPEQFSVAGCHLSSQITNWDLMKTCIANLNDSFLGMLCTNKEKFKDCSSIPMPH